MFFATIKGGSRTSASGKLAHSLKVFLALFLNIYRSLHNNNIYTLIVVTYYIYNMYLIPLTWSMCEGHPNNPQTPRIIPIQDCTTYQPQNIENIKSNS